MIEVSVAYGEQKRLILPDSSEVWLNAGSTIYIRKLLLKINVWSFLTVKLISLSKRYCKPLHRGSSPAFRKGSRNQIQRESLSW